MRRTVLVWLLLAPLTQSCMSTSRKVYLIGGGCTFGASYAITIANSLSLLEGGEEGYGFIPVVGPWLVMDAAKDEDKDEKSAMGMSGTSGFTAFMTSLPQLLGGIFLITGIFLPYSPSYQEDLKKKERDESQPIEFGIGYRPMPGGGAAMLSGSF